MIRIALAAGLALLAMPAAAQDCAAGLRPFEHALGTTCIPDAPQRIASLRDDSITTTLMDIGAPVVATVMRDDPENGHRYVRGASDIFGQDVVDAADLIDLGGHNPPDVEAVAAATPDLIVARTYQSEAADQLNAVAPTIFMPDVLDFFGNLEFLADAAGVAGDFATERARYDARIAKARAVIGDPGAITVSRFDIWEDGLWYYPGWGAIAQVIADIGFDTPAIQAEAAENMNGVSVERMAEFDGDILIASRAPRFGQTIPMLTALWDETAPFWRDLGGELYWYERDILVGYTFASLDRSIDFLTALTAGRDID